MNNNRLDEPPKRSSSSSSTSKVARRRGKVCTTMCRNRTWSGGPRAVWVGVECNKEVGITARCLKVPMVAEPKGLRGRTGVLKHPLQAHSRPRRQTHPPDPRTLASQARTIEEVDGVLRTGAASIRTPEVSGSEFTSIPGHWFETCVIILFFRVPASRLASLDSGLYFRTILQGCNRCTGWRFRLTRSAGLVGLGDDRVVLYLTSETSRRVATRGLCSKFLYLCT